MLNPAVADTPKPESQKVDPQTAEFFETQIRPVLANNCYSCHGPAKQKAGLRLDSPEGLLKGSASGPVISGHDADKSTLVQVVRYNGDTQMPPAGKLPAKDIAAIEAWVKMGAPWPNDKTADGATASAAPASAPAGAPAGEYTITDQQRHFWSFVPVQKPVLPKVKNTAWVTSPLDNYILSKLEAQGLTPSHKADRRTLIRRATYDLIGLPPTPSEVDNFVLDKSPDAFAKVVDRLLASPHYGEKWGRHWLDVARYADSKGYVFEEDRRYPHAYNYRDWVIRAFNQDLPYDQFITQQLAADHLPLGDDRRPLAALGFLTVGRRFLNNPHDIIDDRIDVTMRGFQGLTVGCARCHDHKFDPIPTKDYYSLYGVFANSVEPPPQPISPKAISEPYAAHDKKLHDTQNERDEFIKAQVRSLREREQKNETLPNDVKETLAKFREETLPNGEQLAKLMPAFDPATQEKIKTFDQTLDTLRKTYPPTPELAMTMADTTQPVKAFVFRRGNPANQGDEVPRHFLAILSKEDRPSWTNGSGRLELAQAIASKDNPLTARVMVNRIWLQHFGFGLVRTPSDFGKQGERPSHPELLDYLAWRFMEDSWSIKKLHRLIMLSSTYQQSSDYNTKNFQADPENRLLWRMNRRRLELEGLRDSLLAATGHLDPKIGGPSVELWQAPFTTRRTVYGVIERQNLPGTFRTFDFATPDSSSPQRFRTTVPQQALFLMNSPFMIEQVRSLASRPEVIARPNDDSRVRYLYYLLFGRSPDADELAIAHHYLQTAAAPSTPPEPKSAVWHYGYGQYDATTNRVTSFTPLGTFKDEAYRGGAEFPDPNLHFLQLTATGGHPGIDAQHAAIRRWVAPQDGVVSIKGTAGHPETQGDGVEARIVSSRSGSVGVWTVYSAKVETNVQNITVQKGDTLDFVISCRANHNFDAFSWSNVITLAGANTSWDSQAQFVAPAGAAPKPLSAWERYTQALLMSNEFIFVD
ncbi:MAG: PSD1 domain-containing protein [Abitibacteriaceae bacterium]|nr:PSD1 domain-containing protein [Abditibacteriaceae bacterium]